MSIDVIFFTVNTASNLFRRSPMKTSGGVQEPSGPPHSPYRYTPYTPRAQQRPSQSLSPGATSQLSPSTPVHQQPPLTPQYSRQQQQRQQRQRQQQRQQQRRQRQQQTLRTDQYSTAQVSLNTVYISVDQYSSLAVYVPISSSHAVCRCACGRCRHVTTPTAAAADSSYRSVWLLLSSAIATTTFTSCKFVFIMSPCEITISLSKCL